MNDYKYLVSSPEVKRLERKDFMTNAAWDIIGSVIGGACVYYSVIVWLGQIMPIIISKDAISECRDHLLAELIVTGDVVVNSYKYTVQDLLDMMVAEDKVNCLGI